MTQIANQLQTKIMRQIYFAFARRIATHEITMQIALFALALLVFAKMVHVASVVNNFMHIPVANVPNFIFTAVSHGEVVTLLAIGAMMFTALSLPLRLRSVILPPTEATV
jgi:hypothetical protein